MKSGIEIEWMSWNRCREAEVAADAAVIWILNPGMTPYASRGVREIVVSFWDRSDLEPGDHLVASLFGRWPRVCCAVRRMLLGDNGGWPWRPPLSHDAAVLRRFVEGLPDETTRVLVACEFGISRSRAVAEWIAATTGGTAVGDRSRGEPNGRLSDLLFAT